MFPIAWRVPSSLGLLAYLEICVFYSMLPLLYISLRTNCSGITYSLAGDPSCLAILNQDSTSTVLFQPICSKC